MMRKLSAEALGTFWLVFAICTSALAAAGVPEVGIGWIGVSFAAGLAILTMAFAVGGISGGHFNPAVSLGLAVAGRFEYGELSATGLPRSSAASSAPSSPGSSSRR
jgi:aquaporin Z